MQDVCGCADQNISFRLRLLPSLVPLPNPTPFEPFGRTSVVNSLQGTSPAWVVKRTVWTQTNTNSCGKGLARLLSTVGARALVASSQSERNLAPGGSFYGPMKPICFHVLLHALHFGIFHIFTLLLDAHVHVVTCESEGAFDQRKFSW